MKIQYDLKGQNSNAWKGGKIKHSNGYIWIWTQEGYKLEHRLVYEEHYNCCLLDWAEIHHKNGIKTDNRIENLEGMTNIQHGKLHHKIIDKSDRICIECKATKSYTNKYRHNEPRWIAHPITKLRWICASCYQKIYRQLNKKMEAI